MSPLFVHVLLKLMDKGPPPGQVKPISLGNEADAYL